MHGAELRNKVVNDEIDYFLLKSILSEYDRPREKISTLLKSGVLIRVKKGLYVFGKKYNRKAICKEVLANLIYGPSAISFTYALSFYGLIPERVVTVTNITNKKNKIFDTPLGRFTYQYIHPDKYAIGITQLELDETHNILIATPEKALADQILLVSSHMQLNSDKDSKEFLFSDLRLDKNILSKFNLKLFTTIANLYDNKNINKIADFLDKRRIKWI